MLQRYPSRHGICGLPNERSYTRRPDFVLRQTGLKQTLGHRAATDIAHTDHQNGVHLFLMSRLVFTNWPPGISRLMTRLKLTREEGSTKTTSRALSSNRSAKA